MIDYGGLIRRSWHLTWMHRFLWLLGLFATTTVGSCSPGTGGTGAQWQTGREDFGPIAPDLERGIREGATWASQNFSLLFLGLAALLLLGLAFLVLSLVAQGGMARATSDLAQARRIEPGEAWAAGLRLFWRYLALWLLLALLSLLVALVVAATVGVVFTLSQQATEPARSILLLVAALLALLVFGVGIPAFIAISIAMAFAQRAIAVENVGPLVALSAGFRLLRDHPWVSALAWLISVALSIGAGLAVAAGILLLLLPLGVVAVILYVLIGISPALILYSATALVVLAAWGWLLAAVANTFFWNYWTLVYLNFTGRLNPRLEPVAGG